MAGLDAIVNLKIDYNEIAELIEKTGGWGDVNGTASFCDDGSTYRYHILPETLESHIESGGNGKDFGLSNLRKKFSLNDYPRIRIQAYNTKTAIQGMLDLICWVGGLFGKSSKPGPEGAADSTPDVQKTPIMERVKTFIKELPDRLIKGLNAVVDNFSKFVSSMPDLYYVQIPKAFMMMVPGRSNNNKYVLPQINLDKIVTVNGDFGWTSNGILSKIIALTSGFITTPLQPFFVPEQGMGNNYPSITVKFPLFNDTLEHAKDNYRFIHTILPWNMWVQWGLTCLPAVLYDVSVDGGLKLPMCSASMSVSYNGAMREVDPSWKDAMGQVVTIPDVYILTCTFSSLLNSNFNSYLLSFEESEITQIGKVIGQSFLKKGRKNDATELTDKGRRLGDALGITETPNYVDGGVSRFQTKGMA